MSKKFVVSSGFTSGTVEVDGISYTFGTDAFATLDAAKAAAASAAVDVVIENEDDAKKQFTFAASGTTLVAQTGEYTEEVIGSITYYIYGGNYYRSYSATVSGALTEAAGNPLKLVVGGAAVYGAANGGTASVDSAMLVFNSSINSNVTSLFIDSNAKVFIGSGNAGNAVNTFNPAILSGSGTVYAVGTVGIGAASNVPAAFTGKISVNPAGTSSSSIVSDITDVATANQFNFNGATIYAAGKSNTIYGGTTADKVLASGTSINVNIQGEKFLSGAAKGADSRTNFFAGNYAGAGNRSGAISGTAGETAMNVTIKGFEANQFYAGNANGSMTGDIVLDIDGLDARRLYTNYYDMDGTAANMVSFNSNITGTIKNSDITTGNSKGYLAFGPWAQATTPFAAELVQTGDVDVDIYNTALDGTIYAGGYYNLGTTSTESGYAVTLDGDVTLDIANSTIRKIDGGGSNGLTRLTGALTVNVNDKAEDPNAATTITGLYAVGGTNSFVGSADFNLNSGTVTEVAGINGAGSKLGAFTVDVAGATVGGVNMGAVTEAAAENSSIESAAFTMTSGSITGNLTGDTFNTVTGTASANLSGGTVAGTISGFDSLTLAGTSVSKGNIYGGNNGTASGATDVVIQNGVTTATSTSIYGGGRNAATTNAKLTIAGDGTTSLYAVIGGSFAQQDTATPVALASTNTVDLTISGGNLTNSVYSAGATRVSSGIAGRTAENPASATNEVGTVTTKISGGLIACSVFGGGLVSSYSGTNNTNYTKAAEHVGSTSVAMTGGTVTRHVVAGGSLWTTDYGTDNTYHTASSDVDSAVVTISGGAITGDDPALPYTAVVGGGFITAASNKNHAADVSVNVDDSEINISGSAVLGSVSHAVSVVGGGVIYNENINDTVIAASSTVGSVDINISGGSVYGNVIGGGFNLFKAEGVNDRITNTVETSTITISGGAVYGAISGTGAYLDGANIVMDSSMVGTASANLSGGTVAGTISGFDSLTLAGTITANSAIYAAGLNGSRASSELILTGSAVVKGNVFAGAGAVFTNQTEDIAVTTESTDVTVSGGSLSSSLYLGGAAVQSTGNNIDASSNLTGTATLNMTAGELKKSLFGGALAQTGAGAGDTNHTMVSASVANSVMNISGGSVARSVFAGGRAYVDSYNNMNDPSVTRHHTVTSTVGTASVTISGDAVFSGTSAGEGNSIFGGGQIAMDSNATLSATASVSVENSSIAISGGTIGSVEKNVNVYGGGLIDSGILVNELIYAHSTVGTAAITISGGTINGSVYAGGFNTVDPSSFNPDIVNTVETSTITISGGTISGGVYGSGNNGATVGTSNLVFANTGAYTLNAFAVSGFDTVAFNGGTVSFANGADFSGASVNVTANLSGSAYTIATGALTLTDAAFTVNGHNLALGEGFASGATGYVLNYAGNALSLNTVSVESGTATLYVDAAWTGKTAGDLVVIDGKYYEIGVNAFGSGSAANAAATALTNTINFAAGTYAGVTAFTKGVTINADGAVFDTIFADGVNRVTGTAVTKGKYDQGYSTASASATSTEVTGSDTTFMAKNYYIGGDTVNAWNGDTFTATDTLTVSNGAQLGSSAPHDTTHIYVRSSGQLTAEAAIIGNYQGNQVHLMNYGMVSFTDTTAYFDGFVLYGGDLDDGTITRAELNAADSDIYAAGLQASVFTVGGIETHILVGGKAGKGDAVMNLTSSSSFTAGSNMAVGYAANGTVNLTASSLSVTGTLVVGGGDGAGIIAADALSVITVGSLLVGENGEVSLDINSADATLKFSGTLTNNGTITVDMTNATESSYKLIDSTGAASMTLADYGNVTLTGNTGDYQLMVQNNDLVVHQVDMSKMYVNSDWAGKTAGEEVTLSDGTKAYFGINAFAKLNSAYASMGAGGKLVIDGGTATDAITPVSGKNIGIIEVKQGAVFSYSSYNILGIGTSTATVDAWVIDGTANIGGSASAGCTFGAASISGSGILNFYNPQTAHGFSFTMEGDTTGFTGELHTSRPLYLNGNDAAFAHASSIVLTGASGADAGNQSGALILSGVSGVTYDGVISGDGKVTLNGNSSIVVMETSDFTGLYSVPSGATLDLTFTRDVLTVTGNTAGGGTVFAKNDSAWTLYNNSGRTDNTLGTTVYLMGNRNVTIAANTGAIVTEGRGESLNGYARTFDQALTGTWIAGTVNGAVNGDTVVNLNNAFSIVMPGRGNTVTGDIEINAGANASGSLLYGSYNSVVNGDITVNLNQTGTISKVTGVWSDALGTGVKVDGNLHLNMTSGTVTTLLGINYAQSSDALAHGVTGDINIMVSGGRVTDSLRGGNSSNRVGKTPEAIQTELADFTASNVNITVNGTGNVATVYGGSCLSVTGKTTVNVADFAIVDKLYAGSKYASALNTEINISGGTVASVYAGGAGGSDSIGYSTVENGVVNISGGTVENVYAGGGKGDTVTVSSVNISGGTITGLVSGSGDEGSTVGAASITVSGGTFGADAAVAGFGTFNWNNAAVSFANNITMSAGTDVFNVNRGLSLTGTLSFGDGTGDTLNLASGATFTYDKTTIAGLDAITGAGKLILTDVTTQTGAEWAAANGITVASGVTIETAKIAEEEKEVVPPASMAVVLEDSNTEEGKAAVVVGDVTGVTVKDDAQSRVNEIRGNVVVAEGTAAIDNGKAEASLVIAGSVSGKDVQIGGETTANQGSVAISGSVAADGALTVNNVGSVEITGSVSGASVQIGNATTGNQGSIEVAGDVTATNTLALTNSKSLDIQGGVNAETVQIVTSTPASAQGETVLAGGVTATGNVIITNGEEHSITGGEVAGVEQAVDINAGGDVTIENEGHLNVDIKSEGKVTISKNTSLNTLTGTIDGGSVEYTGSGSATGLTVTAANDIVLNNTTEAEQAGVVSASFFTSTSGNISFTNAAGASVTGTTFTTSALNEITFANAGTVSGTAFNGGSVNLSGAGSFSNITANADTLYLGGATVALNAGTVGDVYLGDSSFDTVNGGKLTLAGTAGVSGTVYGARFIDNTPVYGTFEIQKDGGIGFSIENVETVTIDGTNVSFAADRDYTLNTLAVADGASLSWSMAPATFSSIEFGRVAVTGGTNAAMEFTAAYGMDDLDVTGFSGAVTVNNANVLTLDAAAEFFNDAAVVTVGSESAATLVLAGKTTGISFAGEGLLNIKENTVLTDANSIATIAVAEGKTLELQNNFTGNLIALGEDNPASVTTVKLNAANLNVSGSIAGDQDDVIDVAASATLSGAGALDGFSGTAAMGGNMLTLGGINTTGAKFSGSGTIDANANQTFSGFGALNGFSGTVDMDTNSLTLSGSNDTAALFTGVGTITANTASTAQTFSTAGALNGFSGTVALGDNTLTLGGVNSTNAKFSGSGASKIDANANQTLNVTGALNDFSGTLDMAGNTLILDRSNSTLVSFSGSGLIESHSYQIFSGVGALNGFTGTLNMYSNSLTLSAANTTSAAITGSGLITANAAQTFSGNLSGFSGSYATSASITTTSAATLAANMTVGGNGSYDLNGTVTGGTLTLASSETLAANAPAMTIGVDRAVLASGTFGATAFSGAVLTVTGASVGNLTGSASVGLDLTGLTGSLDGTLSVFDSVSFAADKSIVIVGAVTGIGEYVFNLGSTLTGEAGSALLTANAGVFTGSAFTVNANLDAFEDGTAYELVSSSNAAQITNISLNVAGAASPVTLTVGGAGGHVTVGGMTYLFKAENNAGTVGITMTEMSAPTTVLVNGSWPAASGSLVEWPVGSGTMYQIGYNASNTIAGAVAALRDDNGSATLDVVAAGTYTTGAVELMTAGNNVRDLFVSGTDAGAVKFSGAFFGSDGLFVQTRLVLANVGVAGSVYGGAKDDLVSSTLVMDNAYADKVSVSVFAGSQISDGGTDADTAADTSAIIRGGAFAGAYVSGGQHVTSGTVSAGSAKLVYQNSSANYLLVNGRTVGGVAAGAGSSLTLTSSKVVVDVSSAAAGITYLAGDIYAGGAETGSGSITVTGDSSAVFSGLGSKLKFTGRVSAGVYNGDGSEVAGAEQIVFSNFVNDGTSKFQGLFVNPDSIVFAGNTAVTIGRKQTLASASSVTFKVTGETTSAAAMVNVSAYGWQFGTTVNVAAVTGFAGTYTLASGADFSSGYTFNVAGTAASLGTAVVVNGTSYTLAASGNTLTLAVAGPEITGAQTGTVALSAASALNAVTVANSLTLTAMAGADAVSANGSGITLADNASLTLGRGVKLAADITTGAGTESLNMDLASAFDGTAVALDVFNLDDADLANLVGTTGATSLAEGLAATNFRIEGNDVTLGSAVQVLGGATEDTSDDLWMCLDKNADDTLVASWGGTAAETGAAITAFASASGIGFGGAIAAESGTDDYAKFDQENFAAKKGSGTLA